MEDTRSQSKLLCATVLVASNAVRAIRSSALATYTLNPMPKTVAWGYYDAKAALVACLSQ